MLLMGRPCATPGQGVPGSDSNTSWQQRAATVEDIPSLADNWPDEFRWLKADRRRLEAELAKRFEKQTPCFVAVEHDRLLGAVWFKPWPYDLVLPRRPRGHEPGSKACEVCNLFTAQHARGRGVGVSLLEYALGENARKGWDYAYSRILPARTGSIAVHERIGFHRLGLLHTGRKFGFKFSRLEHRYTADTPKEELPPAVILCSEGPNGLALLRDLGRHGVRCHLVLPARPTYIHLSRYCRGFSVITHDDPNLGKRLCEIATSLHAPPVLYCTSDIWVKCIAAFADEIRKKFKVVNPLVQSARFCSKRVQIEHAHARGVPVPETIFFSNRAELKAQLHDLPFPAICKPLGKSHGGGFKQKCALFRAPDEAETTLAPVLARGATELMMQRYIPGGDGDVLFCLVAFDGDQGYRKFVTGRKIRQSPPGAGVMASGETIPYERLVGLTSSYLRGSGLKGLVGVEFKSDAATGRLMFIEINARPENIGGVASGAGVNLAYLAYCRTIGLDVESLSAMREVKWVNFLGDLRSAWSLVGCGRLTWSEYLRSLRGKVVWGTWACDDPLPLIASVGSLGGRVIRKLLRCIQRVRR
ncbi:MAG: GNAT family N-acetyltransferase [bacterium]